ncbi:MAG: cyclic pyranopterin monophosphate synthase MoaC [Chloroflexi bacterium]|nr:cyclic pyranopterin monophosphate synthase MoaC [Chloroflexota bacterium]
MSSLTHLDESGRARMVDVGHKSETERVAVARGRVVMQAATLELIIEGNMKKGDVLAVAQLAGIMAAKQTSNLIPLCHPLALNQVLVVCTPNTAENCIDIEATARVTGKTGVEMEALTAVSVAALTIYDMAKAADRTMRLTDIRLAQKSGGQSGDWQEKP